MPIMIPLINAIEMDIQFILNILLKIGLYVDVWERRDSQANTQKDSIQSNKNKI